jgi:glucose-6-phosphate 1-dehydrogenase
MNPTITKSEPTVFIIFGGTGDLNMRKLAPALYNLFLDNWLPDNFAIIGTGRTKFTDESYREKLLEGINSFSRSGKAEKKKWETFSQHIFYQASDIKDAETYKEFGTKIEKFNRVENQGQRNLLPGGVA